MSNIVKWNGLRLVVIPEDVSWELILGDKILIKASSLINDTALAYVNYGLSNGEDLLGKYIIYNITGKANSVNLTLSIKAYLNEPVLIPSIKLDSHLTGVIRGEGDVNTASLNANVFLDRVFGYTPYNWVKPAFIKAGELKDSVALGSFGMFIDSRDMNSVITSALEPRAPQLLKITPGSVGFKAVLGLSGTIKELPGGFTLSSLVVYGNRPNEALYRWGRWIRAIYGRVKTSIEANINYLNSLQYWTDTGGMYWYRTLPGMNYAQTMLEIKRYMDDNGIGVKYYQVDSWWYPKNPEDGGALEYHEVPELGSDLGSLSRVLGPIISLHIRYPSRTSPYAQRYPSRVVKNATCITQPEDYFNDLVKSLKDKGVYSIKHDWLTTLRQRCSEVYMSEVGALERYLDALFNAAEKYSMLIELCMPDLYHYFIGAKHNSALMIRTSPDYGSSTPKHLLLYYNAYDSMLAIQLGYAPFFDVMVTTDHHAYADLLARVLFFSAVGIGDAIDKDPYWRRGVNVNLLRRFLTPEWIVLRPDEPAKLTDEMFINDPYTEPVPLTALTHVRDIMVIALFNVHRDLDQVCYTLEPSKLGLPKGSVLLRVNTMTTHEGKVEGCVRKAEPHLILAFDDSSKPRIIGLTKYALMPASVSKINEEYSGSLYKATLTLTEPGEALVYSPSKPISVKVNGIPVNYDYNEASKLLLINIKYTEATLELTLPSA
ncbi:hypothetical protein [Caldivirga sp. UBA161]|uniref:hypothetical protein n=1 Tax=Caldivirga sp. UBA161 TaxID=1915569 RepID=UPI0025B80A0C|nr:hypothetical protein [Caldivirga sp. UBA161]